jgi:hypothetical protein
MNYQQDIKNTFTFIMGARKKRYTGEPAVWELQQNVNAPNRQLTQQKRYALSGVFPMLRRN